MAPQALFLPRFTSCFGDSTLCRSHMLEIYFLSYSSSLPSFTASMVNFPSSPIRMAAGSSTGPSLLVSVSITTSVLMRKDSLVGTFMAMFSFSLSLECLMRSPAWCIFSRLSVGTIFSPMLWNLVPRLSLVLVMVSLEKVCLMLSMPFMPDAFRRAVLEPPSVLSTVMYSSSEEMSAGTKEFLWLVLTLRPGQNQGIVLRDDPGLLITNCRVHTQRVYVRLDAENVYRQHIPPAAHLSWAGADWTTQAVMHAQLDTAHMLAQLQEFTVTSAGVGSLFALGTTAVNAVSLATVKINVGEITEEMPLIHQQIKSQALRLQHMGKSLQDTILVILTSATTTTIKPLQSHLPYSLGSAIPIHVDVNHNEVGFLLTLPVVELENIYRLKTVLNVGFWRDCTNVEIATPPIVAYQKHNPDFNLTTNQLMCTLTKEVHYLSPSKPFIRDYTERLCGLKPIAS
ncbi:unnamed protein product [Coregonus sp. 'balchen']|nr:unnamed protein product [Coregonus sp. 'balchen']